MAIDKKNNNIDGSQGSGVDDQLLRKGKQEGGDDNQGKQEENEQPRSFREVVMQAKRDKERAAQIKAKKSGKLASAAATPIRKGTSKLLQQAWINLIDSFGLTLIWIDTHVFLGAVFGNNFFCKLGEEWIDESVKKTKSDKVDQVGGAIGVVENMGCACLNIGCLLIILAVFFLISAILNVIDNPMKALSSILGDLWGALTGN